MRTIAIVLCDNDYYNTFTNLLKSIYNIIIWHDNEYINNKVLIEKWIREGIGFYNMTHDRSSIDAEQFDITIKYLQNKVKVLFDEEAEKFIETHDHDGGSWYLEMATGKVYSF